MNIITRWIGYGLAACLLTASFGCSDEKNSIRLQGDSEVVVRINGKPLTRHQMNRELINLLVSVGADMPPEVIQQKASEFELQAIQNLINTQLLVEEAERRGLTASQQDIDERVSGLRNAYKSADQFRIEMEVRELNDTELANEAQRGILVEKLVNLEIERVAIPTDSELEDFYNQNKDRLRRPEQLLVSHVLINKLPGDSEDVLLAKREELEHLKIEIRNGADFREIAFQHSNCPSSKRYGELGWLSREQMSPEFSVAAFTMQTGTYSDIVETEAGYHLIWLQDRRPSHLPTMEEIRDDLIRYLTEARRKTAIQSFIEALRNDADIEIVTVS